MLINPLGSQATAFAQQTANPRTNASGGSSANSSDPDAIANTSSDLFLTLLVAQLKTQDPTSPMDPTQMVGQMLSMNQLNELVQIRQLMQSAATPTTQATTS